MCSIAKTALIQLVSKDLTCEHRLVGRLLVLWANVGRGLGERRDMGFVSRPKDLIHRLLTIIQSLEECLGIIFASMPTLRRYFTTGPISRALDYSSELVAAFVSRKPFSSSQSQKTNRTESDSDNLFSMKQIKVTNSLEVQHYHRTSQDAEWPPESYSPATTKVSVPTNL